MTSEKEPKRVLPRTWDELEQMAKLTRNQPSAPTPADAERMRRKMLPSWGRRRKRFYGP